MHRSPTNLVAVGSFLAVVLTVGLPSMWYALEVRRLAAGQVLPIGASIGQVLSVVLLVWTLAAIALCARAVRRPIEPAWFVVLIVLTVLLGGVHLELVHSTVHVACIEDGPLGFTVNCAPWLPRR